MTESTKITRPAGRVSPDWLKLRNPADIRARDAAAGRITLELARFLRRRCGAKPARLVDIGAGTGAGAGWLRPRLTISQRWRLIDHDAALLAAAPPVTDGWARPVVADVASVSKLLAEEPADALTCQALLDLLNATEVADLLASATGSSAALLAAITVTGGVQLTPQHRDDPLVGARFNAHQRRDGRLGPDAADFAGDTLQQAGYRIVTVSTPWRLDPAEPGLMDAWLHGRARAAAEQTPPQAGRIRNWLNDRLTQLQTGQLSAVVQHVDLLGIPPA
jgi:hypothetical protein